MNRASAAARVMVLPRAAATAMLRSMPSETSNRPIRVLLWSPKGSGTHYYGPGSFFYRMYSRAAPGRFEITLAHTQPLQQKHELFATQHFIGEESPYQQTRLKSYLALRRFLSNARRFLDKHHGEFDVMHGLSGFQAIIEPAQYAEQLGLPAVVFLANYQLDLSNKSGLHALMRLGTRRLKMASRLSAVVAMSESMYDDLIERGFPPQRIARIPMGVDTQRFSPVSNETDRSTLCAQLGIPDRPTVVFVGTVTPRKQPHLLVEAIGLLHQRGVECQLVIAGPCNEADYVQRIKQRQEQLGIESLIHWTGFLEDPVPILRAADMFCLPSQSEGMPAAVVEAMACGLPTLATKISGITDLIDDGENGRIILPDAEHIADTIESYLNDPQMLTEHGRRARKRVETRYSTDFVLASYEKLFRTVIAGKPARDWETFEYR